MTCADSVLVGLTSYFTALSNNDHQKKTNKDNYVCYYTVLYSLQNRLLSQIILVYIKYLYFFLMQCHLL